MLSNRSLYTRRVLALLFLLATLAALGAVTVLPVVKRSAEFDASIADLNFRLRHYTRLIEEETPLRTQLSQLASRQGREGLLEGEIDAIAAANLQALFKQWVQTAGGTLESTQILPGEAGDIMNRITLRAQFTGATETLQQVLYQIEYGPTMLFVDRIELRQKRVRRRPRQPVQNTADMIQVSLEISGYRRGEAL